MFGFPRLLARLHRFVLCQHSVEQILLRKKSLAVNKQWRKKCLIQKKDSSTCENETLLACHLSQKSDFHHTDTKRT